MIQKEVFTYAHWQESDTIRVAEYSA